MVCQHEGHLVSVLAARSDPAAPRPPAPGGARRPRGCSGRTLADLLHEKKTELTVLPWVGTVGRPWPPEPIRFAAVRGVNAMLRFADRAEMATGRTSGIGGLAHLISGR
ncbi:MAG: hypothetical protein ACYCSX_16155 [Acidimicrobiales bacterium]